MNQQASDNTTVQHSITVNQPDGTSIEIPLPMFYVKPPGPMFTDSSLCPGRMMVMQENGIPHVLPPFITLTKENEDKENKDEEE